MNIAKKKRPCKFSDEKKRHGDYYHHREKRYVNKKGIRGSHDSTIYHPPFMIQCHSK